MGNTEKMKALLGELKAGLESMNQLKVRGKEEIEKINLEPYVEEEKVKQREKIQQLILNGNKEITERMQCLLAEIRKEFAGLAEAFDYSDQKLQSALMLINSVGEDLPEEAQNQIIQSFRGNPTALKILHPLFIKNRYFMEDSEFKACDTERFERLLSSLDDGLYYNMTITEPSNVLQARADELADYVGLLGDTEPKE